MLHSLQLSVSSSNEKLLQQLLFLMTIDGRAVRLSHCLRDRFRQEEVEMLSRFSQIGYRDIFSHLFLVASVQDFKHLVSVRCHLNSVKVNVFCSKLLYLLLN